MIKHFLNWIKGFFYKEKKDVVEIKKEEEPKIKCETHYPRYKKSCTVCRAAGEK
jgi:desulfoferrodoxin (superoxide reductase-like protein)|tara:strand:- start:196 stop:357 length:162 start_codon:yes stop_codon:yes gene_type:complete